MHHQNRISTAVAKTLSQSPQPTLNTTLIQPAFYTIEEACARLGLPLQTARNWINEDVFVVKTKKMRGRRVVPVILLEEYIQKLIYEDDDSHESATKPITDGQKRKAGRPPKSLVSVSGSK